jgi:hypothetical protein
MALIRAHLGLWLVNQLRPADADFHVAAAWRLTGRLDEPRLRAALDAVVAAHDALRGYYPMVADEPCLRVRPPHPVRWEEMTGSTANEAVNRFARRPFDLTEDEVLRAGVLHEAPDRTVVALCVHHIACDGVALRLLCEEWSARYAGTEVCAPGSYRDALAARSKPPSNVNVAFWRQQIADQPPALFDDAVSETGRTADMRRAVLSRSQADALAAAARAAGVTPHMRLLAAFAGALATEYDRTDLTIGTPVAARGPREADVIGCLVNVLPIRLRHPDLAEVRQSCLAGYAHQGMPAEAIAELRGGRPRPLHEAVLSTTVGPRTPLRLHGVRAESVEVDLGTVQVPLDLDADWDDGLTLTLRYDSGLVPAERGGRLLDLMLEALP